MTEPRAERRPLAVVDLGTMDYAEALEMQRAAAHARISGALDRDTLILVEHPPVITLGRSTDQAHLLGDTATLEARGIELFDVERGGDITFHGPGQLVGYPIIDLRNHQEDLHWYLRQIEAVLIAALGAFGIAAERRPTLTGVWTGNRKIASIGVHARSWVTWHGFALNVTTDLTFFGLIVPCGIDQVEMTSVARELGDRAPPDLSSQVRSHVAQAFAGVFSLDPEPMSADELRSFAPAATGR